MKKQIPLAVLAILLSTLTACDKTEIKSSRQSQYMAQYLSLVKGVSKRDFKTEKEALQAYILYANIPDKVYLLHSHFDRIATIAFSEHTNLRKPFYPPWPEILVFSPLKYVFENGDILFADNILNTNIDQRMYVNKSNSFTTNPDLSKYPDCGNKRILLDGTWQKYYFDKNKSIYKYIVNGKEEILEDYQLLPKIFNHTSVEGPIRNDYAIILTGIGIDYINEESGSDLIIALYNWRNKSINRVIGLPFTFFYRNLNFYIIDDGINIDKNNRVYIAFFIGHSKNDSERSFLNEKKSFNAHIMIYDPGKNILYNIHHPFWDNKNNDEQLLAYQYGLGEDEKIYYQLVTEKAYYIYKITPLWNEPMEETGYNPIFFELHPELKTVWDSVAMNKKQEATK